MQLSGLRLLSSLHRLFQVVPQPQVLEAAETGRVLTFALRIESQCTDSLSWALRSAACELAIGLCEFNSYHQNREARIRVQQQKVHPNSSIGAAHAGSANTNNGLSTMSRGLIGPEQLGKAGICEALVRSLDDLLATLLHRSPKHASNAHPSVNITATGGSTELTFPSARKTETGNEVETGYVQKLLRACVYEASEEAGEEASEEAGEEPKAGNGDLTDWAERAETAEGDEMTSMRVPELPSSTLSAEALTVLQTDFAANALGAIGKLCAHQQGIQRLFGLKKGCETVALVLVALPQSIQVQRHGCLALCNLAALDENAERLGRAGACEAVLSSLRLFGEQDPGVAEEACGALRNLCWTNSRNRDRLGFLGAAGAIVMVSRAHSAVPSVREWCSEAASALCQSHDDNRARLRAARA